MIAEHAGDQRVVRIAVAGEGGQEHLLLEAEVGTPADRPEGGEGGAGLARVAVVRAAQLLCDDQGLVVTTRE